MCLSIIRSIPSILVYYTLENREKVDFDMDRSGKTKGALALHKALFFNKVFRRLYFTRVLDESSKKYKLIRWTYSPMESLEISSLKHKIGKGLYIYHGYSTIIFCNEMGENCSIYQNVTLGRGKTINGVDVPTIENNVTIYAGANIIGGVIVGENSIIGAGAVVVKDVPPNSIVAGNPAKVIRSIKND